MPLLVFPSEILYEIIRYVAIPPAISGYVGGSSPPSKDIYSIAATCRLLRSLALEFIYSKVIVNWTSITALHKHLTTYPHIAACIRELDLYSAGNISSLLPGILMNCTGIQDLCLNTNYEGPPMDIALSQLAPGSKESLRSLKLHGGLLDLSKSFRPLVPENRGKSFGRLQEVQLLGESYARQEDTDSTTLDYLLETSAELGSAKADSVGILRIVLPFPYRYGFGEPAAAGQLFAKLMPNVGVLFLGSNSECTYSMLSAYIELGSNLTELTLEGKCWLSPEPTNQGGTYPHHFCEIIPKLSQNLTKFCIYSTSIEHRFCHLLFGKATDWPKLAQLDVTCQSGCIGIQPDLIHTMMTELTQIRPQISLRLGNLSGRWGNPTELVCWNLSGEKHIAPPEDFKELDPSFSQDTLVDPDSDSDSYDYDYFYGDDYDYDDSHRIEDLIEDHYDDFGF